MKKPSSSDKAGIYLTVIFHLLVIIVLLLWQIGAQLKKGDTFEITISEFEKFERILEVKSRLEEEVAYKQAISQRIDAALAGSPAVRNIATSRNAPLKDDRGTDAEQLYKDAEKLQKDLSGRRRPPRRKRKSPRRKRLRNHIPVPRYCPGTLKAGKPLPCPSPPTGAWEEVKSQS